MHMIITAFAAFITTIIWCFNVYAKKNKLSTLVLMYWGAALMWLVDGFFALAEGEAFIDFSADGALLGLLIICCGLVAWVVIRLFSSFLIAKKHSSSLKT